MKTLIFLANDDWSRILKFGLEKMKTDWTIEHTNTAFELLEKMRNNDYNGIIIVFNPFILKFKDIWPELQELTLYKKLPILFLTNFSEEFFSKEYIRKGFDDIINFCECKKAPLKVINYLDWIGSNSGKPFNLSDENTLYD